MTTIAYRNGTIAADSGMCVGDMRLGQIRKIGYHATGGVCGGAGFAGYVAAFIKWFEGGERGKPPVATTDNEQLSRAIIIRPGKLDVIETYEPEGPFEISVDYYALGSGREVALGAFFVGAEARDAVRAAIEHEKHTWGRIDRFDVLLRRTTHGRHKAHPSRRAKVQKGTG